jgi:hypothetical protein
MRTAWRYTLRCARMLRVPHESAPNVFTDTPPSLICGREPAAAAEIGSLLAMLTALPPLHHSSSMQGSASRLRRRIQLPARRTPLAHPPHRCRNHLSHVAICSSRAEAHRGSVADIVSAINRQLSQLPGRDAQLLGDVGG